MKRFFTVMCLLLVMAIAAGCSSVDYLKDVGQSFEELQTLNGELNDARKNADKQAFARTLDDMKRETERIRELEPGSLTKKASKEVKEKNEAISALVEELILLSATASFDDPKVQEKMEQLEDELWDSVN